MRVVFVKNAKSLRRRSRSGIIVCFDNSRCREVNVRDIEVLVVLGSKIDVESGVISLLSSFNIPVAVVSKLGTSILSVPTVTLYNEVRRRQYAMTEKEKDEIMLNILMAKFKGLANILKYYNHVPPNIPEFDEQGDSLLHWEATVSRTFWNELLKLLPPNTLEELKTKYGFEGRKPRSKDPFNKSISLLYAILYAICLRALLAAGLDPTYGLHHKTRYSTPLVYDYSEMYKPAAIHTVIKTLRSNRTLELDKEGNLTREAINTIAKELFKTLKAKILGTRHTTYRLIYINTFRLADRIKGNTNTTYTYTYNPKKLKTQETS